jgi:RNA-directed DNA polymerase
LTGSKKPTDAALEVHRESVMKMRGCWIVEVKLRKYFDTVDHGHLKELLRRRVRDEVVVRLLHKWLTATDRLPNCSGS